MVAIQSLISVLAMTLMANAAPADIEARVPPPGAIAAGLKFFAAGVSNCDQSGTAPIQVTSVFTPPGTPSTDTCFQIGQYGSVAIDTLQPGCVFTQHISGVCADPGVPITSTGCKAGQFATANFWKVTCT